MEYQNYFKQFTHLKILVIGEMLLDTYLKGTSARICREAPVPIVDIENKDEMPGGASNTAVNVAALGVNTSFISVGGQDADADKIISYLKKCHIDTSGIVLDKKRNTLIKKRIVSDNQLLLRYDYGSTKPISPLTEKRISTYLKVNYSMYDAIIASDYGYGIFTPAILKTLETLQKKYKKVFVVDSKQMERFQKIPITAIKPNYEQTIRLLKKKRQQHNRVEQILQYEKQILTIVNTRIAAVTIDVDGGIIFEKRKKPFRTYTKPMPNSNASGAGDTFVSALTASLAVGIPTKKSAEIASKAASIVVQSGGTSRCTLDQLKQSFISIKKIMTNLEEIMAICQTYREQGKKIVFTSGCFDILHKGHIQFIKEAKQLGDILIVGLNSDMSVKKISGKRPFNSLKDRMEVLKEVHSIDHIIPFDDIAPLKLITGIKPDVFVKGGNYQLYIIPEKAAVKSYGGEIKILGYYPQLPKLTGMFQVPQYVVNSLLL